MLQFLAGIAVVAASLGATAQVGELKTPGTDTRKLPTLLDAEVSDWLKRGDFVTARKRCALEIQGAPLVSEPGALAQSYMCLGEAYYGLGQHPASADAFAKTLEQLEQSAGVFDPLFVRPLEGLGKALLAMGKLDVAEGAFTQAKDITHRNFGIFNVVQSDIVNYLAKTYLDRGEIAKATREQNFLMRAHTEAYGETPRLLPALRRYGRFQELVGTPALARNSYRRALDIMTRAYGSDDLRLVGPLRDFAKSYINTPRGSQRIMSGAGVEALRNVIDLYSRQEFTDAADVALAWADLGDWYVIGGQPGRARKAYTQAGTVLREAGSEEGDRFSKPVEIEYEERPVFLRRSQLRSFPKKLSVLEFEFTVTASGRVTRLTVIRDDLQSVRYANEVGALVKESRYRPRIVDGVPVDTPGVRKVFRYDFSQFANPAQKEPDAAADAAVTEGEANEEAVDVELIVPEEDRLNREPPD